MKKNIIFIIVDTLRADALKAMPNIRCLASQGVFFTNAYVSSTKTDPSISSIFSGKYPHSIGLISHGQWISKKEEENIEKTKFLAEILRDHGYQTLAVDWLSRWHARGFDQYSGKIVPDASADGLVKDQFFYLKYFRKIDRLILVKLLQRDFLTRLLFSPLLGNPIPYDPADVVINRAIKYLNRYGKRKFFLYLHFWDPHWPHVQPKSMRSLFLDSVKDRYLAEAQFVDKQLGQLFEYLKRKNLMAKTLIIFTADHGESLTEHGIFIGHQGLYEEVVKVPLIFYHPQFKKKKIQSLVSHIDIFPTILDILKIEQAEKIDGKSLLPLIKGQVKKIRDYVFFIDVVFGQMKIKKAKRRRGIRRGNYKYLQYLKVDDKSISRIFFGPESELIDEELFNLKKDPQEQNNLVGKQTKKKEELKKLLESHLAKLRENIRE